jgi:hypothetical protein
MLLAHVPYVAGLPRHHDVQVTVTLFDRGPPPARSVGEVLSQAV